MIDKVDKHLI